MRCTLASPRHPANAQALHAGMSMHIEQSCAHCAHVPTADKTRTHAPVENVTITHTHTKVACISVNTSSESCSEAHEQHEQTLAHRPLTWAVHVVRTVNDTFRKQTTQVTLLAYNQPGNASRLAVALLRPDPGWPTMSGIHGQSARCMVAVPWPQSALLDGPACSLPAVGPHTDEALGGVICRSSAGSCLPSSSPVPACARVHVYLATSRNSAGKCCTI